MVERFFAIRQHERRDAAVGFATLLVIMAGHAMLETARDALFLATLPASDLPWAYLTMAVLAIGVNELHQRLSARFARRRLLAGTLLGGALITLTFWERSSLAGSAFSLIGFYVWTGLFATVAVVQYWLLLGDVVDVRQAQRLFAIIGAGGLLGAALGSGFAWALLKVLPAQSLLIAASLTFVLAAALPYGFTSRRRVEPVRNRRSIEAGAEPKARDPYRGRMVALVLLSTLLATGVDYTFKAVVAAEIPGAELGNFFARYYALIALVALVVQLFLAPRLLSSLGVSRTLMVVPLLLLATSLGVALTGGLLAVLLLRASDGATRHSVARTAIEILYLPLGSARERFKAYIEAVGQRGGQALASLAILGAVTLGIGPSVIGWALFGLAAACLICIAGLEGNYVALFRHQLRQGTIETRVGIAELDLRSLEALVSALSSEKDAEVIGALDLFAAFEKTHLIPALILFHPSPPVVLRAFELFEGSDRAEIAGLAARLLRHPNHEVRAAALRHYAAAGGALDVVRECLERDDPAVRATATVGMIAQGELLAEEARRALEQVLDGRSAEARQALALSLRLLPDEHAWVAEQLVSRAEPGIAAAVARSLASKPSQLQLRLLISLLDDREARLAAREALIQLGEPALDALEEVLMDAAQPRSLRRHLPRTISRFRTREAFAILERALGTVGDQAVESKLLRALVRMRTQHPSLPIESTRLMELATRSTKDAIRALHWRLVIDAGRKRASGTNTAAGELLSELLRDHELNAMLRVFRLMQILKPEDEFGMIYEGLRSTNSRTRVSSRELLAHLVPPELKSGLLALTDDLPDRDRLVAATSFHDPPGRAEVAELQAERDAAMAAVDLERLREVERAELGAYANCLREMLAEPSGLLRSVAGYHVAELGLGELREELVAASRRGGDVLRGVTERALSLLEAARRSEYSRAH